MTVWLKATKPSTMNRGQKTVIDVGPITVTEKVAAIKMKVSAEDAYHKVFIWYCLLISRDSVFGDARL